MEELQMIAFEIIAAVGDARKYYSDAVKQANAGAFDTAKELIRKGNEELVRAQEAHLGCIQREADGEMLPFSILFMHSEDQLFSAELVRDMSLQLISVYEKINEKEGIINETGKEN